MKGLNVISKDQLVELLDGRTKHEWCGIETETKPTINKYTDRTRQLTVAEVIGCEPSVVRKVTIATVGLGFNYSQLMKLF